MDDHKIKLCGVYLVLSLSHYYATRRDDLLTQSMNEYEKMQSETSQATTGEMLQGCTNVANLEQSDSEKREDREPRLEANEAMRRCCLKGAEFQFRKMRSSESGW